MLCDTIGNKTAGDSRSFEEKKTDDIMQFASVTFLQKAVHSCFCHLLLASTYLTGMSYTTQENTKAQEIIQKFLFLSSAQVIIAILGIQITMHSLLSGPF